MKRALAAILLAACSSTGGDGSGDDDTNAGDTDLTPYLEARDYCETIAPFFCTFYMRCARMNVPDEEACAELFAESCESKFESRYVDLETAGLLRLSRVGVDACREHLETVACAEQIRELRGPCLQMWEGQQSAGETCAFDFESFVCAPGTACTLDLSLCGTCETVVADGEDCSGEGVTCSSAGRCVNGTCRTRKLIGETCEPSDDCELGARCESGTCVGPSFVGVGQACDSDNRCPYGTVCTGGLCEPTARQGESCPATACETGYCNGTVCLAPGANGDTCDSNIECASGNCDLGRCVGLPSGCF